MGDTSEHTFRVGTRKSELALIQTNSVTDQLSQIHGERYKFALTTMDTLGDKILDKPLPKIGEKSLFTQELENALEDRTVDFVVHSLKDLPTILPPGKVIGAILKRLDPRDCVIVHEKHEGLTLAALPQGCVIGTSSLRRSAQLNAKYPHLKVENIRGNMNTRLKKLNDGLFDAIVVAVAGIQRLNWGEKINEPCGFELGGFMLGASCFASKMNRTDPQDNTNQMVLDHENFMYAVGQGALAVECMEDNAQVLSLLTSLMDRDTVLGVTAERSFLRKLEGGCSAPVAVNSTISENVIRLSGMVCSLDGGNAIRESAEVVLNTQNEVRPDEEANGAGDRPSATKFASYCGVVVCPEFMNPAEMEAAEKLGEDLAESMIAKGAATIMKQARQIVTSTAAK